LGVEQGLKSQPIEGPAHDPEREGTRDHRKRRKGEKPEQDETRIVLDQCGKADPIVD
jgi:hypothetical protein